MRFKGFYTWFAMVLFWLLLGTIGSSFSYHMWLDSGKQLTWAEAARGPIVAYGTWGAILTPIVVWLSRRFRIERNNWPRMLGFHLLASFTVACFAETLRLPTNFFTHPEMKGPIGFKVWTTYFYANGYDDMWMYWLVLFVSTAWMYYQKYRDRELKAAELETQLAKTQLQMLKVQLHPHFLFNTLHSVSELMHQDVERADRMIVRLSDLLRMSLDSVGTQEVALKRELEFLERYLEIEQTRFQDRLLVRFDIDPATLDAKVPNMVLQPIAENAVKHGIAKKQGLGEITISSSSYGQTLELRVCDNGPGWQDQCNSNGVGVTNTKDRLQRLYGNFHSFETRTPDSGGCEVLIRLPLVHLESVETIEPSLTFSEVVRPIAEEVKT